MWEFLKASKEKGGERVGQEGIKGQRDESEIERERERERVRKAAMSSSVKPQSQARPECALCLLNNS